MGGAFRTSLYSSDATVVRGQGNISAVGVVVVDVAHEVVIAVRRFPGVHVEQGPQAVGGLHFRPQRLPLGLHHVIKTKRKRVADCLVEGPEKVMICVQGRGLSLVNAS